MIVVDDSGVPEDHTGDESSRWEEEHGPTFGEERTVYVIDMERLEAHMAETARLDRRLRWIGDIMDRVASLLERARR